MRHIFFVFLLAYAVRAAPTPPDDQYFLTLKYGESQLAVRDLCFADSSAYFNQSENFSASYLALKELDRIDRDTQAEK